MIGNLILLDQRMAAMPNGQGFRLFKDGVTQLSHLKGQDFRHMMVQLLFAMSGLVSDATIRAFKDHASWYAHDAPSCSFVLLVISTNVILH